MHQYGGAIIGSGSQGCIFSPKLIRTKKDDKIIASQSNNNSAISKVFADEGVWEREHTIMESVMHATGGRGVVLFTSESPAWYTANNLNDDAKAELASKNTLGTGCKSLRGKGKYYVINQPRIIGDIRDFQAKYTGREKVRDKVLQPPSFFLDAYIALMNMRRRNLVHMDIASRNIFFDRDRALIGDFGYTINLKDETSILDASFAHFATSHGVNDIDRPATCFTVDQITPEAFIVLSILRNWSKKSEYLAHFESNSEFISEMFKYDGYDPVTTNTHEEGWIVLKVPTEKGLKNQAYTKYLEVIHDAANINTEAEFKGYALNVLLKSDIKRFIIVIAKYLDIPNDTKYTLLHQVLNLDNFNAFYELAGSPSSAAAPPPIVSGAMGGAGAGATSLLNFEAPNMNQSEINYMIAESKSEEFLYKETTPEQLTILLSELTPDAIQIIISKIRSDSKLKPMFEDKIANLFSYYEKNKTKLPEQVGLNIEKIFDGITTVGGRRTMRRRRHAKKTRKSKRLL